jgi:hypothetical protein
MRFIILIFVLFLLLFITCNVGRHTTGTQGRNAAIQETPRSHTQRNCENSVAKGNLRRDFFDLVY